MAVKPSVSNGRTACSPVSTDPDDRLARSLEMISGFDMAGLKLMVRLSPFRARIARSSLVQRRVGLKEGLIPTRSEHETRVRDHWRMISSLQTHGAPASVGRNMLDWIALLENRATLGLRLRLPDLAGRLSLP